MSNTDYEHGYTDGWMGNFEILLVWVGSFVAVVFGLENQDESRCHGDIAINLMAVQCL